MNNKTKLGLFLTAGILAIMISIIAAGSFSLSRTYKVYAYFNNIVGVTKKAKVKIAGVDVGVLREVSLENEKARLTITIDTGVVLYKNAKISIVSSGIIGTKYLEVNPGTPDNPKIKDGDVIESKEAGSMEDVVNNMVTKVNSVLDEFAGSAKEGNIIGNLAEAVRDLKSVMQNISSQNAKIAASINNINDFSKNLAQMSEAGKRDLQDTMANIKSASERLDILISKLYEGDGMMAALIGDEEVGREVKETISNAKDAVATAKTAVESLTQTLGRAESLRFQWDYMGRYNVKDEKFRNDLGISIIPGKDKFYYVGISNVGDANEESDSNERHTMNRLEALMGFRSKHLEIYGGVMRGTAGGGFGISFLNPIYEQARRLQLHFNAYNFGRKKNGPEMDADLRFGFTRWLFAGVSVEDISYKTAVTPYIKIEIDDKDLASLLGIVSIAAVSTK
ncbi:MAG: MlaD family protein [Endomicrobium sp.]|jgi:phospholipid/cholesterol/gamma-HCH transport system substrate-binding protein|nr:MlaD family protein [Endomicrobium sp.]